MIYLASTSPRRKMLLKKAGFVFRVLKPDYREDAYVEGSPEKIVKTHAIKKAQSCMMRAKNGVLIAADTLVCHAGRVIGKPKDMKDARLVLAGLQGKWHFVYTGVAIFKMASGRAVKKSVFFAKTRVCLARLTNKQIKSYFKRVSPLDKAGAYAIQSSHRGIVKEVKGSFSNAIGLPMEKLIQRISSVHEPSSKKKWNFYLLKCSDGSLYAGATTDIERRVREHNSRKGAAYTRSRLPVKLFYREGHLTRSKALRREAQVKGWTRAEKWALAGSNDTRTKAVV